MAHPAEPALQDPALVDVILGGVAHAAAPEQLGLAVIGVPASVPDFPAHEIVLPRDKVGVGRSRVRDDAQDLVARLRGAALVGIEAEDPGLPRVLDPGLTELAESPEFNLDDPGSKARRDLDRPVGAERVDHDNLRRPGNALEGRTYLQLLVSRKDEDRYRRFGCHGGARPAIFRAFRPRRERFDIGSRNCATRAREPAAPRPCEGRAWRASKAGGSRRASGRCPRRATP